MDRLVLEAADVASFSPGSLGEVEVEVEVELELELAGCWCAACGAGKASLLSSLKA